VLEQLRFLKPLVLDNVTSSAQRIERFCSTTLLKKHLFSIHFLIHFIAQKTLELTFSCFKFSISVSSSDSFFQGIVSRTNSINTSRYNFGYYISTSLCYFLKPKSLEETFIRLFSCCPASVRVVLTQMKFVLKLYREPV